MVFKAALWLAWLALGLVTMLKGDISRTSYACVWVTALTYMLLNMLDW